MNDKEEMENPRESRLSPDNLSEFLESMSPELDADALRDERDKLKDALQRAQADLVNYRRRRDTERADLVKYRSESLLSRLLPILDELALALDQPADGPSSDSWLEGFHLINRKLNALLELEGVEQIDALGKQFDPAEHEALAQQQSSDKQDGEVLMVVRNGYKLHNRLLRPAQVIVAVNDTPPQPESEPAPASNNQSPT